MPKVETGDQPDFRITYTGRRSGKAARLTSVAENYRKRGYRIEERDGCLLAWAPRNGVTK